MATVPEVLAGAVRAPLAQVAIIGERKDGTLFLAASDEFLLRLRARLQEAQEAVWSLLEQ